MAKNGIKYPFCVTGDVAFLFAGKQTLEQADSEKIPFGVIVIDNGGASSTGGQKCNGNIYDVQNAEKITVNYSQTSQREFAMIFRQVKKSRKLTVIYVKK